MATEVYLPKLGMTMEEGTLTKWLVDEGAPVKRGQILFEMETEKVQMEVEAEADGVLHRLVPENTTLKPGDIVGALLAPGEAFSSVRVSSSATSQSSSSAVASSSSSSAPAAEAASGEVRVPVTPIARRLANENSIDLATVHGSGPNGRIVEADIRAAIEAKRATPELVPAAARDDDETVVVHFGSSSSEPAPAQTSVPYSGRRRTIGERMHASLRDTAQLTLTSETPVDEAMSMLHGLNREWRRDEVVITLSALVVRACALALKEHQRLNARLEGDVIVTSSIVNVGLAIDLEEGLMVPVIRHADSASLKDVASQVRRLTAAAKANRLTVDDLTGGTFTVTSLEGSVVDGFTPVLNPPQAAILGIGRVREVAGFDGPNVVRRQVTTLSLTFDHRITDGGPAARFLDRVAELLSRPYMLM